jgi:RNA polymerase sigma-70 factor (ECF subfamily)
MRRESVTMAFLVLLETLTPAERAAFLLREVFDGDYYEIARVLETTETTARQLVHRAKSRIAAARPRFEVSPERQTEIVTRFYEAVQEGDVGKLQEYLSADVEFAADGGGKVAAVRRPVIGADAVAHLMVSLWHKAAAAIEPSRDAWHTSLESINGEPALVAYLHGQLDTVFVFSTNADRITAIRAVRNPDKLVWLGAHSGGDARAKARPSTGSGRP